MGKTKNKLRIVVSCWLLAVGCWLLAFPTSTSARLNKTVKENKKLYGKELKIKQYSESKRNFSGKIIYKVPNYDWRIETIYTNGVSFSESARPDDKSKKQIIKESDANVIADKLFPKYLRGKYRKQVKNANFISHFFDNGIVSYEMQLDKRRRDHVGISGIRTLLYQNKTTYDGIKINAYH